MEHENEYHDNLITLLELIWGDGYMAPGGRGNVARLLQGIDTEGRRILDIGCGIGGPAFDMARLHGAEVVGIDLESPLIERATRRASELGLAERCTFQTVQPGALPFPAESFDIVVTSAAITQTPDKATVFAECFRVLRPDGFLSCYDWMRSGIAGAPYSKDMQYWFKLEGLTYALETLSDYDRHFRASGFEDVRVEDASDWYRQKAREEYDLLKGALYPRMVELLGETDANHFVENWRALVIVCDQGEMRQGYCRGHKPA